MRSNLGRIFLTILIFLHLDIFASTYSWSAEADKSTAMTNEAIYLKYICEFSDAAGLYVIEFNPVVDNEKYKIEMLSETEKIVDGKKINSFEFIAFVKEAGKIEFTFDTTMKKTNKDSIENTVLGRDNADYEEFSTRIIKQKRLSVEVLHSSTDLVGQFILTPHKDVQQLKAYEPYHLEVRIEGIGNFKALKDMKFHIDGVKIFAQKPMKNIKLTQDGYRGSWSQKFAFVGDKDFTIPALKIEYFDLEDRVEKSLVLQEIRIEVTPAYKKEELLDVEEEKFAISSAFLYYILTFIAGYLFAQIRFKRVKNKSLDTNPFRAKVMATTSLEELMIILALEDSRKYEELILEIESKKSTSLSKCKKRVLD